MRIGTHTYQMCQPNMLVKQISYTYLRTYLYCSIHNGNFPSCLFRYSSKRFCAILSAVSVLAQLNLALLLMQGFVRSCIRDCLRFLVLPINKIFIFACNLQTASDCGTSSMLVRLKSIHDDHSNNWISSRRLTSCLKTSRFFNVCVISCSQIDSNPDGFSPANYCLSIATIFIYIFIQDYWKCIMLRTKIQAIEPCYMQTSIPFESQRAVKRKFIAKDQSYY